MDLSPESEESLDPVLHSGHGHMYGVTTSRRRISVIVPWALTVNAGRLDSSARFLLATGISEESRRGRRQRKSRPRRFTTPARRDVGWKGSELLAVFSERDHS